MLTGGHGAKGTVVYPAVSLGQPPPAGVLVFYQMGIRFDWLSTEAPFLCQDIFGSESFFFCLFSPSLLLKESQTQIMMILSDTVSSSVPKAVWCGLVPKLHGV